MIHSDYLVEQIRRLIERLGQVRERVRLGELEQAARDLEGLVAEAEELRNTPHGRVDSQLTRLLAAALGELGVLEGARGFHKTAQEHLESSLKMIRELEPERDQDAFDNLMVALMNLGAMKAAMGDLVGAEAAFSDAIRELQPRIESESSPQRKLESFWMSLLKNRATAREQAKNREGAVDDLSSIRDYFAQQVALGRDEAVALQAAAHIDLSGLLKRQQRVEEFLESSRKALELANRAVDLEIGPYQSLFVRAKIALADAHLEVDRFDACEDGLFEAVRAMPELIESVITGLDMYSDMMALPDSRLEAGGLPRDEVVEGYRELLHILASKFEQPILSALAEARFEVLLNREISNAQQLIHELLANRNAQREERIELARQGIPIDFDYGQRKFDAVMMAMIAALTRSIDAVINSATENG